MSSKGQRGDTRLGVVPEQPRSNPSASSCRACPVQLHAEEKGICSSSACSAARRGRGNNAPRPASRGAAAQHHAGAAACAVIHRGRSALSQRVCRNHGTHGCPVASPGKSCPCSGLILSSEGFFSAREGSHAGAMAGSRVPVVFPAGQGALSHPSPAVWPEGLGGLPAPWIWGFLLTHSSVTRLEIPTHVFCSLCGREMARWRGWRRGRGRWDGETLPAARAPCCGPAPELPHLHLSHDLPASSVG